MKRILLVFLLGAATGAAGYWYVMDVKRGTPLREASDRVTDGARRVEKSVRDAVADFKTEHIQDELNRTSMVVREKARQAGEAIADAATNAKTTATIKAKLVREPGLSAALHINVDTTDGLVTLSGTASSHQEIAQAVKLALETEGVHKVVSTLQVRANP